MNVRPIALLAVLALAGCGGSTAAKAPKSTAPSTIAVRGTFILITPNACGIVFKPVGYDDIARGAEVVIADDAGKTLALTKLTGGKPNGAANHCTYQFAASVPAGKGFYEITVTHRGAVKESEADMAAPRLTLGS